MNVYVIRNNQRFGPYEEQTLLSYVNNGQVLKQDKAISDGDSLERTVGFYLKRANLQCHVQNKGNVLAQLSAIGSELILPMVIMNIPLGGFFIFYEVSLFCHLGIILLCFF